jgi:galactokinase
MSSISALHAAEYDESPGAIVSVPGVVTVMGEYSDLCDGFTLAGALDQTVELAVSKRNDNSLRFYSADFEERKRTTIPNLKYRREDRWANYIKGVLYELFRRNYVFKGLNITVKGSIPQKVGLKSSTALCTAAALAVKELHQFDIDDTQLIQAVYFAETSFMQSKARLVDVMTMLYAREGYFLLYDMHSLDYTEIQCNFNGDQFLITESDIPQFSIREELIYREEACHTGLAAIRERSPGSAMREISSNEIKSASENLPEDQKKICFFVLDESRITREAAAALAQKDSFVFGKLMNRLQAGLRDLFEVSCPEVDWLTKRAMETHGCFGSKMIGPGFGGCTITLLHVDSVAAYTKKLEEYEHIFGFHPAWFMYQPAGNARILKA